jgi:hypothetical protein
MSEDRPVHLMGGAHHLWVGLGSSQLPWSPASRRRCGTSRTRPRRFLTSGSRTPREPRGRPAIVRCRASRYASAWAVPSSHTSTAGRCGEPPSTALPGPLPLPDQQAPQGSDVPSPGMFLRQVGIRTPTRTLGMPLSWCRRRCCRPG